MFYRFSQNNSGGSFDHDEKAGIGYAVVIEADNADEANDKAMDIGLYFDGRGDCTCCGNRWSTAYDYGEPKADGYTRMNSPDGVEGGWGIPSYIHYKDGTIKSCPCLSKKGYY